MSGGDGGGGILFSFINGLNLGHLWQKIIRIVRSVLGAKFRYALWEKSTQLRCTGRKIFSDESKTSQFL